MNINTLNAKPASSLYRRSEDYILVADDDSDDQLLMKDALAVSGTSQVKIHFVNDGQELLSALKHASRLPNIILLDLNMPVKDDKETLLAIRQCERLRHIPVIIFTTSSSTDDIRECYLLGSNTYVTKPRSFNDLVTFMSILRGYGFDYSQTVAG